MSEGLLALARLLAPEREEEDDDDGQAEGLGSTTSRAGPGSIGALPRAASAAAPTQVKPGISKEIWRAEEVPEGSEADDTWDSREQPEYEILFKQHVGAEDIFLGMSRKDPSTACCEDMLPYSLSAQGAMPNWITGALWYQSCASLLWRRSHRRGALLRSRPAWAQNGP
ncbi:dynein axonemal assembly factor 6 isoform X2 [Hemicordylus capensis]|uniref:dynein axonemal assembly factor 6 isoform X2 n=1 Tax=Hemicordylus capensis TaxID=884348 RepID=UPI002301FF65|nr:dynein axonemal assembly factor 6 isoform X2 [Hemicordylus capensis]